MKKSEVEKAQQKVHLYEKRLSDAKLKVIDAIKKSTIECKSCKKKMIVGTLTVYEKMWYTEPHGCTGGDYWNSGKDRWVVCQSPDCSKLNRFYDEKNHANALKVLNRPYVEKYVEIRGDIERVRILGRDWV